MKSWFILSLFATATALATNFPSGAVTPPPPGWTGPVFALSQNYPATNPGEPTRPWESVDLVKNPDVYLKTVIDYCYEGFLGTNENFLPPQNTKRAWYHAPWLAREFVHGLTNERTSVPLELSPTSKAYKNFAVGFYNGPGGFTIGQVWGGTNFPNTAQPASFPNGTVTFKLLFSTAPVSDLPFLQGAPEWVAYVSPGGTSPAVATTVRLLQIDIAVKDARSHSGGWVFGTFHYDNAMPGASPWQKLRPLVLMWGDDPTLTATMYQAGKRPTESWVNPASPIVQYRQKPNNPAGVPNVMGWAGRGNGPVDNPISSCMSCHGTAAVPATFPMFPPATPKLTDQQKLAWFKNLKPGQTADGKGVSMDFSLQLAKGIQNYAKAHPPVANTNSGGLLKATATAKPAEVEISR
jgi:hypothetical protein